MKDTLEDIKAEGDRSNWVISQVIQDPKFNPDVLVIEECCDESDLKYFNKKWLDSAYATVIVFPSNSTWHQSLGMMLKPGFEVVKRMDQYYKEPDPVGNERGDRL